MNYMQRALSLAHGVKGATSPSPAVGAVVVKDGRVVGEGATQPGGSHAEIMALTQAGGQARGATLYVTLEPHCFQSRTPPCTQAIIAAGIAEVSIAVLDRNPRVAGNGRAELEAAGIHTSLDQSVAAEAAELVEAHERWITSGLPFVTVKYAMTLDGKIATVSGQSRWITGEEARSKVHDMRRTCDAIMVGVNTAIRDDPQLTARDVQAKPTPKQPIRVVVDSLGRLPATAKMLKEPGITIVAVAEAPAERITALKQAGAEVLQLSSRNGHVDLEALLQRLGQRQVTSLLVEGGGTLLAALFTLGLVDKVFGFIAPRIIGGGSAPTPVEGEGIADLKKAVSLDRVRVETVGNDILIVGYPRKEH